MSRRGGLPARPVAIGSVARADRRPSGRGKQHLDIQALQTRLRTFAAERDWQPLHTPKNLAMALMVEAAELAEIFQWLTPEQSQAARGDRALQGRVADELADVLLYLVQIADHAGVDLPRAVDGKLARNAQKHPPLQRGHRPLAAGDAAAPQAPTHVLVDLENVQPGDDDIRSLVPELTDVWLFHGPNQKGVAAKHASLGDKARLVKIARTGRNALDFHLSFYAGYIAALHPGSRIVVIANDKGYASMLEHAVGLGVSARQVGFDHAGVAARSAAKVAAAKPAAPATKAAGHRVAAKQAPVKPAAKAAARATAKKGTAQAPPVDAPAVLAAKPPVARKAAARPRASPAAAGSAAAAAPGAASPVDLARAVRHVLSSLGKSDGRPARRAKLVAAIGALLGQSADEQTVQSVLAQLLAGGHVTIDAKGLVRYAL